MVTFSGVNNDDLAIIEVIAGVAGVAGVTGVDNDDDDIAEGANDDDVAGVHDVAANKAGV